MTTNELKNTLQNEEQLSDEAMNAVSGGKIRYKDLRNIPIQEREHLMISCPYKIPCLFQIRHTVPVKILQLNNIA